MSCYRRFEQQPNGFDVGLRIVAVDSDITAPGLSCADSGIVVPRAGDPHYLPAVMDVIRRYQACALIPTADTDLPLLSEHRDDLEQEGCVALIAEPRVIDICRNKLKTYHFLCDQGIDTPITYTRDEILAGPSPRFPLFSKPRTGSASDRVNKINDTLDLDYFLKRHDDLIVQEFLDGQEYTLDVYIGLTGRPGCVVPRAPPAGSHRRGLQGSRCQGP